MKILVVDDHALVREGLRQVLKGLSEGVEVLDAPDCAKAFELAAQHADLDLVLLDYHLPDMSGLVALDVFGKNHPELPILMVSGSVNPHVARQVLAKGAAGFITKSGNSQELLEVVRLVLAGEIYAPPELLQQHGNAQSLGTDVQGAAPLLTPRQEEVLYLLLDGCSTKDISQALQLGEETAKSHVGAIMRAFGVRTRIQAVVAAGRFGYARSGSPS